MASRRCAPKSACWSNVRGACSGSLTTCWFWPPKACRANIEGLEPWDLSQLAPYQPKYLAGFGPRLSVDLETGFADARQKMDRVIERDIKFDIGGDRHISSVDTDVSAVTFKHVLLPVWLAAYKYRGQSYRFVVNGQSGRVQGERPCSMKIAGAVVLGLIVAAGGPTSRLS